MLDKEENTTIIAEKTAIQWLLHRGGSWGGVREARVGRMTLLLVAQGGKYSSQQAVGLS